MARNILSVLHNGHFHFCTSFFTLIFFEAIHNFAATLRKRNSLHQVYCAVRNHFPMPDSLYLDRSDLVFNWLHKVIEFIPQIISNSSMKITLLPYRFFQLSYFDFFGQPYNFDYESIIIGNVKLSIKLYDEMKHKIEALVCIQKNQKCKQWPEYTKRSSVVKQTENRNNMCQLQWD